MTTCDLACSSRVLFAIRAVSIIVGVANITMVLRLGLRHLHHFNNKFCQSKILGKKKIPEHSNLSSCHKLSIILQPLFDASRYICS